MADPMTQSSQISSSQGLVDGQNSFASSKDSKFSDSFLSSSPVSLIQSPQDQRVMPSEGVATSLRFSSQPGFSQAPGPAGGRPDHYIKDQNKKVEVCGFDPSFSGHSNPVTQGFSRGTTSSTSPLDQDSPIKTSPVSERIKALEALAAKQSDCDTWNDGGFLFKERHYEKSSTDIPVEFSSPLQKKEATHEQDSPESPFEVLGDTKQGNEFEDTVDWMRAHLPPVPNFGSVPDPEVGKEASVFLLSEASQSGESVAAAAIEASVPDAFMDSPNEASQTARQLSKPGKQTSVEEESEFDLSFLPTAYIWEKQEKMDNEVQGPLSHAIFHDQEPPAPPAGFESTTPPSLPPASQPTVMEVQPTQMSCGMEPAEILEVDSSGESDDTVIEDTASVFVPVLNAPSAELVSSICSLPEEKDMQPTKLAPSLATLPEKQAIVVPTINVIETDDQVCSDYDEEEVEEEEDDEGYQVVKDPVKEGPQQPSQECEVFDSAVQDDSVTESTCGPSEICTSEPRSQEDNFPPSMTISDIQISPKYQCKEESHVDDPPSAISAGSPSKEIAQNSSVSKEPESDVLQSMTSEKMQMQNELSASSSLNATESTDENIYQLTDPVDSFKDVSKETQLSLFDSDSNDEATQYAPPGPPSSSNEKSRKDSFKEDLLQSSSVLVEPSKPSTVPDLECNEYVKQSSKAPDADTPTAMLDGKPVIREINLDIKTKTTFSNSEPQSYFEPVVQPVNVPSEATAKAKADVGDVGTMDAKESFPKPVGGQPSPQELTQDPFSCLWAEPQNTTQELAGLELNKDPSIETISSEVKLLHEELAAQTIADIPPLPRDSGTVARDLTKRMETRARENSPETMSKPESIELECSVSATTDSFVEFMRECLKSRQDEELEVLGHDHESIDENPKTAVPHSMSPPAMVFDVEQEHLTIRALKELGDSQEEQEYEKVPLQLAYTSQTSVSPILLPSSPPCGPLYEISASKMAEEVDMWVAEAYHLAEHVLAAILTHLSVRELLYWRDPKKSGIVFGTSLLLLLSLAAFSVISVVSYLLLALLCVTITFRIYKSVIQAVQKSNDGHPFKDLMEKDVSVPPETFRKHVDVCLSYINRALKQLSRLFLVEDLIDSLKLAVLMWLMTYVGAVFNGITILILADILLFSMPLVYEKNKTQIDHYLEIAHTQFNSIISKLHEKLPGAVKRSKVE